MTIGVMSLLSIPFSTGVSQERKTWFGIGAGIARSVAPDYHPSVDLFADGSLAVAFTSRLGGQLLATAGLPLNAVDCVTSSVPKGCPPAFYTRGIFASAVLSAAGQLAPEHPTVDLGVGALWLPETAFHASGSRASLRMGTVLPVVNVASTSLSLSAHPTLVPGVQRRSILYVPVAVGLTW